MARKTGPTPPIKLIEHPRMVPGTREKSPQGYRPPPGHYPRPKHAPGYEPRGLLRGSKAAKPKSGGDFVNQGYPGGMAMAQSRRAAASAKAAASSLASRGRGTNRADEIFVNSVKLDPSQVTDRRHHGPPPANKRQR